MLPPRVLNERCPTQKTLALSSLRALGPREATLDELPRTVANAPARPASAYGTSGHGRGESSMTTEASEMIVEAGALRAALQRLHKLGGKTPGPGIWRLTNGVPLKPAAMRSAATHAAA